MLAHRVIVFHTRAAAESGATRCCSTIRYTSPALCLAKYQTGLKMITPAKQFLFFVCSQQTAPTLCGERSVPAR